MFRWMVGGGMETFEYYFVVIGFCFGRNGELINVLKIGTEFYFKKTTPKTSIRMIVKIKRILVAFNVLPTGIFMYSHRF